MQQYLSYLDPTPEYAQLFDSMGPEISYTAYPQFWTPLDPQLGSEASQQFISPYDWDKYHANHSRSFAAYDRTAHGFGLEPSAHPPTDDNLYQLGLATSWHEPDDFRSSLRYVSPIDGSSLASASSFANSDYSTFSDHTPSPDMTHRGAPSAVPRAPTSFVPTMPSAHETYSSPVVYAKEQHSFSPNDFQIQLHSDHYLSTPEFSDAPVRIMGTSEPAFNLGSPTACSLKDLQLRDLHLRYIPDHDDELTAHVATADIIIIDHDVDGDAEADLEMAASEIKINLHPAQEGNPHRSLSASVRTSHDDGMDLQYGVEDDDDDADAETDEAADEGLFAGEYVQPEDQESEQEHESEEHDAPALRDNDEDSDFTPTRRSRGSRTSLLRTSTRHPKRTSSVVQDINVRVHKAGPKTKSTPKRKPSKAAPSNTASNTSTKTKGNTTTGSKSKSLTTTYHCPFNRFGCKKYFCAKNEWKRHTLSQHLCLGYFRCDVGACHLSHESGMTREKGFNDFRRKDLFVQHLRRMHYEDFLDGEGDEKDVFVVGSHGVVADDGHDTKKPTSKKAKAAKENKKNSHQATPTANNDASFDAWIELVRTRCWIHKRNPPSWCVCGICGQRFNDPTSSSSTSSTYTPSPHRSSSYKTSSLSSALHTPSSLALLASNANIHANPSIIMDVNVGKAWDEKMEHVARHYERDGIEGLVEGLDEGLREWAVREGVVEEDRGVLVGGASDSVGVDAGFGLGGSGGRGKGGKGGKGAGAEMGRSRSGIGGGTGTTSTKRAILYLDHDDSNEDNGDNKSKRMRKSGGGGAKGGYSLRRSTIEDNGDVGDVLEQAEVTVEDDEGGVEHAGKRLEHAGNSVNVENRRHETIMRDEDVQDDTDAEGEDE